MKRANSGVLSILYNAVVSAGTEQQAPEVDSTKTLQHHSNAQPAQTTFQNSHSNKSINSSQYS